MSAWSEAQYVIDELREEIRNRPSGLKPPMVQGYHYEYWGELNAYDFFFQNINKEVSDYPPAMDGVTSEWLILVRYPDSSYTNGVEVCRKKLMWEKSFGTFNYITVLTDRLSETPSQGKKLYYGVITESRDHAKSDVFPIQITHGAGYDGSNKRLYPGLNSYIDPNVSDGSKAIPYSSLISRTEHFYNNSPLIFSARNTKDDWGMIMRNRDSQVYIRRFLSCFIRNYPAAVNDDGTVRYWLDPKDYKKKIDGTPSDWNNPDFDGNFCAWIGRAPYYMGIAQSSGNLQLTIGFRSITGVDGFYDTVFRDKDQKTIDGIWIPMTYAIREDKRNLNGMIDSLVYPEWNNYTGYNFQNKLVEIIGDTRRVPFGDSPTISFLRNLLYLISLSINSQGSFGPGVSPNKWLGSEGSNLQSDVIPDNGEVLLPGFHYRGSSEYGFVKVLHSLVPCSNIGPVLDPTTYITINPTTRKIYGYYNYRNRYIPGQSGSQSFLYNGSYTDLEDPSNWIRRMQNVFDSVLYLNGSLDMAFQSKSSYEGASSATYYGDSSYMSKTNLDMNDSTTMVGRFCPNSLDKDYGTLMSCGLCSTSIALHMTTSMSDLSRTRRGYTWAWMVLPPPNYDPFVATNYYPWLTDQEDFDRNLI